MHEPSTLIEARMMLRDLRMQYCDCIAERDAALEALAIANALLASQADDIIAHELHLQLRRD